MTSDYRKRSYGKKGSTINLKVLGATANLPYGLQAYGKDCVGDKANASKDGYFAYIAAPMKKKAIFIHERKLQGSDVFHVWENTKSNDAPPGKAAVDRKPKMSPVQVEKKIASMQKAIDSVSKRGIESHTILKGRWSGYVKCPSGEVILTRDIANFATLALVSSPTKKKWSWAIHIKDLNSTHWFTSAQKKLGSKGIKSVSLTGSKGTMAAAFNEAMKELLSTVAKAATVKETVRRASVDRKFRQKERAKGRKSSPMTKGEAKSYKKTKAKGVSAGAIGRAIDRAEKELARAKSKAAKEKARAKLKAAKAKARAAAKAKAERKKARDKAKAVKARAAAKAKRTKAKAKAKSTKAKKRETPLKSQKALKGKYVTFTAAAGPQLKGKVAYIEKVAENGRGNWSPDNGGAKLYVLAVGPKGNISNRLKTGTMEYKKGKRTFDIKGKGDFNKRMKLHADKRGAKNAVDIIGEIYGGPSATAVLGKRIVSASKKAPAKAKPKRKAKAKSAPKKKAAPKVQVKAKKKVVRKTRSAPKAPPKKRTPAAGAYSFFD